MGMKSLSLPVRIHCRSGGLRECRWRVNRWLVFEIGSGSCGSLLLKALRPVVNGLPESGLLQNA